MRLAVGFLIGAVALACRSVPPPLSEADQASIKAVGDSFMAYFRTDRDSLIAELYTEHAVLMPPNQGTVEGRAAIRAFFQNYPAMADFTGVPIEIEGRGDLAYVRGTYSFSMPASGRQPAVNDHGKFVEIRRKQPDGKWLMAVDIFNSDVPLPTK